MDKQLIRDALDDYARRNARATVDLWPGVAAQLRATRTTDDRRRTTDDGDWSTLSSVVRRPSSVDWSLATLATLLVVAAGIAAFVLGGMPGRTYLPAAGGVRGPSGAGPSGSEAGAGGADALRAEATPTAAAGDTPAVTAIQAETGSGHPGLDHAGIGQVARLGTVLNASQTIGGYTVTLQRAYADANQIIVLYTIGGPVGEHIAVLNTLLKGKSGAEIPLMFGMKDFPAEDPGTYAFGFDAADLGSAASNRELNLSLSLVRAGADGSEPPIMPDTMRVGDWGAAGASAPGAWETIAGPFSFDFTVAVTDEGTRVIDVNQTVSADGSPMTLERVVITPGETRAIVRFVPPTGDVHSYGPVFSFQTGNAGEEPTAELTPSGRHLPELLRLVGKDRMSYSLLAPLTGEIGEWTLTVTVWKVGAFDPAANTADNPETVGPAAGPWIFKFIVPPVR
jgi:hypothetical protein